MGGQITLPKTKLLIVVKIRDVITYWKNKLILLFFRFFIFPAKPD